MIKIGKYDKSIAYSMLSIKNMRGIIYENKNEEM